MVELAGKECRVVGKECRLETVFRKQSSKQIKIAAKVGDYFCLGTCEFF